MKRNLLSLLLPLVLGASAAHAADHEIGLGVHYWTALDDIDDTGFDLAEDGTSWVLAYQIDPVGLFAFEIDVEVFDEGFGGSRGEAIVPQVFLLVGGTLYGGVGVGYILADDFDGDETFFAARFGLDFTVLPRLHVDLNANYQADSFGGLDQVSSDSITLGAMVRFRIR